MGKEYHDEILEYPKLDDFQQMKKDGEFLEPYPNDNITYKTFVDKDSIKKIKSEQELLKEKERLEREEIERKHRYESLIRSADKFFEEKNWKEAKKKYLEAIEIYPDEEYPKKQKSICDDNLLESGLEELSSISEFSKGKVIINKYKRKKGKIATDLFPSIKEFIKRALSSGKPSDWKSLKRGNWKDIKGWVGEETAQKWYNELKK
jgi:hypothetical protein